MKSIIARYGEMKANPLENVEIEGEIASFNKTEEALNTVGISMKDASLQLKDFDDVVFELSEKWDTLDRNTQRYIATVMAGNRYLMLAVSKAA